MRRFAFLWLSTAIAIGMMACGCAEYQTVSHREAAWGGELSTELPEPGAVEELPAAEPVPQTKAPQTDPARAERLVIYNAVLHVVVDSVEDSLQRIKTSLEAMGGYMQEMGADFITLKLPADRFRDALTEVEKLGEVAARDIKGTDVTEKMRDLRIRLENAEKFRGRMLAVLDKSQTVEDTLKIEKELERITETIELLKGKIRYFEHNVAFSTVTVRLNSPVPQKGVTAEIPFKWVYLLGNDLTRGASGASFTGQLLWWRRVKFDLPEGYAKYYELNYRTRAMSGEGGFLKVRRYENTGKATGAFWIALIRRHLVELKAFVVKEETTLDLRKEGRTAHLIVCGKQMGRERYGYLVAVVARKKHVYVFQAWGPEEQFNQDRSELEKAIKSIR